jgi:hypothetical protein
MNDYKMIGPTHPEWPRMWESLYDVAGSYTDHNPQSGEFWQYTGTFWKRRPPIGSLLPTDLLVHQFRHRDRPSSARPIAVAGDGFGRVVIELTAGHEYSGHWNHPIKEGALA